MDYRHRAGRQGLGHDNPKRLMRPHMFGCELVVAVFMIMLIYFRFLGLQ